VNDAIRRFAFAVVAAPLSLLPVAARAHCDTLDGPVVKTARTALDSRDPRPVLAWVKSEHEPEIRAAFLAALEARTGAVGSSDASDRRFYETLVRVHRAGEGAAYTGLKPAGAGVGSGVRAADQAVDTGDLSHLERTLLEAVRSGLRARFTKLGVHPPPGKDVAAGRDWVAAYVDFVHHVERLEGVAGTPPHEEGSRHPGVSAANPHARSDAHAHAH
jgi:hypothetical protein